MWQQSRSRSILVEISVGGKDRSLFARKRQKTRQADRQTGQGRTTAAEPALPGLHLVSANSARIVALSPCRNDEGDEALEWAVKP